MLPYPIRENGPPNRENNKLVVHQRPFVALHENSDEGLRVLKEHHWGLGVISHDSLKLSRERASQRCTQPTEDSNDAARVKRDEQREICGMQIGLMSVHALPNRAETPGAGDSE
ncbi:hypothetical protein CDAR_576531 [Caerostris darwini]|uniref:Uncharacterized protein n=1 Tax=Caerostris darwini TaxID=1538125 RepID=A0AAV4TIX2_9ARAC|nr:hypothetical protein CDAR_576531 [Caerostris darwini]